VKIHSDKNLRDEDRGKRLAVLILTVIIGGYYLALYFIIAGVDNTSWQHVTLFALVHVLKTPVYELSFTNGIKY